MVSGFGNPVDFRSGFLGFGVPRGFWDVRFLKCSALSFFADGLALACAPGTVGVEILNPAAWASEVIVDDLHFFFCDESSLPNA